MASPTPTPSASEAAPAPPVVCDDPAGDGVVVDAQGVSTGEPAESKTGLLRSSVSAASWTIDLNQRPVGELRMRLEAESDAGSRLVLVIYQPGTATFEVQAGDDDATLQPVKASVSGSENGRISVPLGASLAPLGESFRWRAVVADLGPMTGDVCPDEGTLTFPG
jgi:hypothetical protein